MSVPEIAISEVFSDIDQDQDSISDTATNKSDLEIDKYGFLGGKEYTDPE